MCCPAMQQMDLRMAWLGIPAVWQQGSPPPFPAPLLVGLLIRFPTASLVAPAVVDTRHPGLLEERVESIQGTCLRKQRI